MVQITFHGAAGKVTGSKHLLTTELGEQILLDCGLFQGEGQEGDELNRKFGFDPLSIDFVVLSHAHIDHTGLLPRLYRQGFRGVVYCNEATKDLCRLMLSDSAHIQETDLERVNKRRAQKGKPPLEALYDMSDVEGVLSLFEVKKNDIPFSIGQNTKCLFTENAHILGSVSVTLYLQIAHKERILTFTGDIGRPGDHILDGPYPFPASDYIICESTYGDRVHPTIKDAEEILLKVVHETCVERGGKVIIPAFSVDRTQELVYLLDRLSFYKKLPPIKVYVDSPMSVEATRIMNIHREYFNAKIMEYIAKDGNPFDFPNLHYVSKVEESKKINEEDLPSIIISASGMAEAGRIKHHIANNISNEKNTILLVGYATPMSLAGQLKAGNQEVKIFGDLYKVFARIETMDFFSAHADYKEMLEYLSVQPKEKVKEVFLVHGDQDALGAWKSRLLDDGFKKVSIAHMHQSFEIN